jgi:hypothetical protein
MGLSASAHQNTLEFCVRKCNRRRIANWPACNIFAKNEESTDEVLRAPGRRVAARRAMVARRRSRCHGTMRGSWLTALALVLAACGGGRRSMDGAVAVDSPAAEVPAQDLAPVDVPVTLRASQGVDQEHPLQ